MNWLTICVAPITPTPSCMEADPASLNRQHWQAHGNDLASFLTAHPVQR